MVAISLDLVLAIPIVITLAIIVSLILVNLATNIQSPPVANIHTELVSEYDIQVDLNEDGDLDDSFWLISGTISFSGNNPSFTIEPVVRILFKDVSDHRIRFAAIVEPTLSAVVVRTGSSQVVIGLG